MKLGNLCRAAVTLCLLSGLAVVAPAPVSAAARPTAVAALIALTADGSWDDDDYDWYRQTLVDVAQYDTEPEVRTAAQAALAAGTNAAVKAFVDTGWATARSLAVQRKAKLTKQVNDWAKNGGPKVKERAAQALKDGDYAIAQFVAYGYEIADKLDHPVADDAAEQARIRSRVEQMVAFGGPTVMAEGMTALGTGDPVVIAEFYRSGYFVANQTDFDNRESIRAAVEARNSALEEIAGLARTAATAASARAEILAANIEAMKLLNDSLVAMQLGVKASRRADQILEEDKPARKNGKKGRTADLEALRVEATTQAKRASAAATQADSTIATVQMAAAKLIQTGQSHGVDWAKVTIAAGSAIQAAAASAETSQHAAEATLADSLALDADANAQLHAKNADKWLAAAKKQAGTAKSLADVAKVQQKVAEDAAARAKQQRQIAEDAARRAGEHAASARSARITAQAASRNAIGQSRAAIAAHNAAADAAEAENTAISKANTAANELSWVTTRCNIAEIKYNELSAALQKARDEATAAGQDADAATADIAAAAGRARAAYEAAQGWAARAREAAATARAEAEQTTAAASQARAAAVNADRDAATARRASDTAEQAVRGAVQAAEMAKLDAQRTQREAEAAVQESSQAVFQAQVADQAAGAAAASAELAVDRADTADYIAAQFAGLNDDARRIMQVTAEAILVSKERQAAAQKRADEAGAAAEQATQAAEHAVGDIKPAYEAAAQAVKSANDAATAAVKAHNAAVDATNQANGANQAAARASQYEQSAWGDASIAGSAAQSATAAATIAGKAADDADRIHKWAQESTLGINTFAKELADQLDTLTTEKQKQDAIDRKKKEFEAKFALGLLTLMRCKQEWDLEACKKVGSFILDKGKQALDAGLSYLDKVAKCHDGDEAACKAAHADNDAMLDFMKQVARGIWEGAKSFVAGIKMLTDCMSWVAVGTDDPDFLQNCGKTIKQIEALPAMLKEHPFELIHLSEWQDNPGKALGLTLFDIGTFFVPGVGEVTGVLAKLVSGLEKLLATGVARLANGVGTIERFTVKLAGEAGRVAKLVNVTVKIDGGLAELVDGIAIIDGVAYMIEATGLKLTGAAEDLVSGMMHIDGGAVRLEGKIAKLENATVKVEKPKGPEGPPTCAGKPCGDQPDGSWIGEEFEKELRLAKPFNDEANKAIKLAEKNEKVISPKISEIVVEVPGATKAGWDTRLKTADSLKRKIVGEHKLDPDLLPGDLVRGIMDNVRYTMTFEADGYVIGVETAVRAMKARGFGLYDFKNFWANLQKDYKGINSVWVDPATGQYFELQFHTSKSFRVNKDEHQYYERWRNPESSPAEIAAAKQISKEMWGDVEMPSGADLLMYP